MFSSLYKLIFLWFTFFFNRMAYHRLIEEDSTGIQLIMLICFILQLLVFLPPPEPLSTPFYSAYISFLMGCFCSLWSQATYETCTVQPELGYTFLGLGLLLSDSLGCHVAWGFRSMGLCYFLVGWPPTTLFIGDSHGSSGRTSDFFGGRISVKCGYGTVVRTSFRCN